MLYLYLKEPIENDMEDNDFHDLEFDELSEEDMPSQKKKTKRGVRVNKPKTRKCTSLVWTHFVLNGKNSEGLETAKCKHCAAILLAEKSYGASHLKRHAFGCKKRPRNGDVRQQMVTGEARLAAKKIDQSVVRELITLIIICHDLPFSFVEYPRVRELLKYLNPEFKAICRNTAVADVLKFHGIRKDQMKQELAKVGNRICLTCDVWRSISIEGYICLTAHYVDDSWKLKSKILSFCAMPPPHSGFELAKKVISCLEDWGIEKKIFSLTLDNASANDNMQSILRDQLSSRHGLLCDGEFFHIRCSAHILNLIVQDGLKFIEGALHKIRETVKWIKWSEGRKDMFIDCVKDVGLKYGAGLKMDVSTRWNSTYLMLGSAIEYRRAFSLLQRADRNYKYCPSNEEWDRAEKIHDFLEPFYDITNLFSGMCSLFLNNLETKYL